LIASDPVFSPNGTKIAFRYSLGDDIWTIKTDGTELTNVTDTPERWESSPDWRPMPIATTMR
jgi:Tol biopolymer transport system component